MKQTRNITKEIRYSLLALNALKVSPLLLLKVVLMLGHVTLARVINESTESTDGILEHVQEEAAGLIQA